MELKSKKPQVFKSKGNWYMKQVVHAKPQRCKTWMGAIRSALSVTQPSTRNKSSVAS